MTLSIEGKEFNFQNEFFWVSKIDISSYTSNNLGKILEDVFKNPFQSIKADKISIKIIFIPDIREATFRNLFLPVDVKEEMI